MPSVHKALNSKPCTLFFGDTVLLFVLLACSYLVAYPSFPPIDVVEADDSSALVITSPNVSGSKAQVVTPGGGVWGYGSGHLVLLDMAWAFLPAPRGCLALLACSQRMFWLS